MLSGQVIGQQYSDQQWAADAAEPADAQRPTDAGRPDRCWIVDGGERDDAFLAAADAKAGAEGRDVEDPIGASYRSASPRLGMEWSAGGSVALKSGLGVSLVERGCNGFRRALLRQLEVVNPRGLQASATK